jgi:F-type H+-transporting ATPase subunit delta
MNPLAVARRYARVLADVACEKDRSSLEAVSAGLDLAAKVVGSDPALLRFFDDPSVRVQDKEAAIATLARKGKLDDLVRRFLDVLVVNRRLGVLPVIAKAFRPIKDQRLGIVAVDATLAVPMRPPEQKKFREALEKMTGRAVRLTLNIDPAVLGGARTRVGSRVYDGTLKCQLEVLRRRLVAAR